MPRPTVGETVQYASHNLSVNHGNIWKGNSDNTLKSNLSQVIAGSPKELGESMNHDVGTMKSRHLSPASSYYGASWSSNEIQILCQEGQVYRANHAGFYPSFCNIRHFFSSIFALPFFAFFSFCLVSLTLDCTKSSMVSIGVKSLASAIYTSYWGCKTSGNMAQIEIEIYHYWDSVWL